MIGKQLNALLESRKITAYRVAVDLKIDHASMSRYRNDKAVPKPKRLKEIADYFNVSVSYLFKT